MFQKYLVLLSISIILVSCRSNTVYDSLVYDSESYAIQHENDPDALLLCDALEGEGYVFDTFYFNEFGIQVNYSDQDFSLYSESEFVSITIVMDTNRDYDNPSIYSDEEHTRLQNEAQNFCESYYQMNAELDIDLRLSSILLWDFVDGVRGQFYFDADCNITGNTSWSTGSYANRYEEDSDGICPSGRVRY